jgi:Protein kinase domain.
MIIQKIDDVTFNLNEYRNFSFLSKYGKAFCVFDKNDSGNISFGLEDGKTKYFIKIAGAKTTESCRQPKDAIESLKNAMMLYDELKHTHLIELLEHYELDDLYIVVFKWVEGECLFDYWNFEKYSKNPQLQSPKSKYKKLSLEKRIKSVNTIFEFLSFVESKGYVAIDFYDGSIIYDFAYDTTTICDIDFFRKKPAVNDLGEKFWGTKRLKSPEEYVYGAVIDTVTNVYTLGALIFHFFGCYTDEDINKMYKNNCFYPCKLENWQLDKELYDIVIKAVDSDRSKRYKTMAIFYNEWNNALHTL